MAHNYTGGSHCIQSCHSQQFSFKRLYFLPGYSCSVHGSHWYTFCISCLVMTLFYSFGWLRVQYQAVNWHQHQVFIITTLTQSFITMTLSCHYHLLMVMLWLLWHWGATVAIMGHRLRLTDGNLTSLIVGPKHCAIRAYSNLFCRSCRVREHPLQKRGLL